MRKFIIEYFSVIYLFIVICRIIICNFYSIIFVYFEYFLEILNLFYFFFK